MHDDIPGRDSACDPSDREGALPATGQTEVRRRHGVMASTLSSLAQALDRASARVRENRTERRGAGESVRQTRLYQARAPGSLISFGVCILTRPLLIACTSARPALQAYGIQGDREDARCDPLPQITCKSIFSPSHALQRIPCEEIAVYTQEILTRLTCFLVPMLVRRC